MKAVSQVVPVELPEGDLVETWVLARRIARAFYADVRYTTGIDAIVGKLVPSKNGMSWRQPITKSELDALQPLLEKLPAVGEESTEEEREVFLYAYAVMPERFEWTPVIADYYDVLEQSRCVHEFQARHMADLQREISAGRIIAFGESNTRAHKVGLDVMIARSDALTYLRQRRIVSSEETHPAEAGLSDVRVKQNVTVIDQFAEAFDPPPVGSVVDVAVTTSVANISTHPSKAKKAPLVAESVSSPGVPVRKVLLRRRQVEERTGLSRNAIYDRLKVGGPRHDPSFPRQIRIGNGSVGWLESEINNWIDAQMNLR